MPNYVYVVRQAVGNAIVSEVPAYDVHYEYALNGFGEFSFKVAMAESAAGNFDPLAHTVPKRFVLCIERDGVLVFAGIMWSRVFDYTSREITVTGNEWGSIYDQHILGDVDYYGLTTLDALDHLLLAAAVNPTGNLAGCSPVLGVISQGSGGGLSHTIEAAFTEAQHMTVFGGINQLASSDTDGFEYRWASVYNAGALEHHCVVGSPLGSYTGAILDHSQPGGSVMAVGGAVGGAISGLVVDQKSSPTQIHAYTYDGFIISTLFVSYFPIDGNEPVFTEEGWTFSPDYSDNQVQEIAAGRFSQYSASTVAPVVSTYTVTIVSPISPSAYGVEGDTFLLVLQGRASQFPGANQPRIVRRSVDIDPRSGMETLTIQANL